MDNYISILAQAANAQTSSIPMWVPIVVSVFAFLATGLSAFSSFMQFRINNNNRLDAIRPELVIEKWSTKTDGSQDLITFLTIRNVGEGIALDVTANSIDFVESKQVKMFEYELEHDHIVVPSGGEISCERSMSIIGIKLKR